MHIILWMFQIGLAIIFMMTGITKVMTPYQDLAEHFQWVRLCSPRVVSAVGVLEILGGLGLVIPTAFNIRPSLTLIAAFGLLLTMCGAMFVHLFLGETSWVILNIALGSMASFIIYGRLRLAPICDV